MAGTEIVNFDDYIGSYEFYMETVRIGAILTAALGLIIGVGLMLSGDVVDGIIVVGGFSLLSYCLYELYSSHANLMIAKARSERSKLESDRSFQATREQFARTREALRVAAEGVAENRRRAVRYFRTLDEVENIYQELQRFIDSELPEIEIPENPIDDCLKGLSDEVLLPLRCPILLQVMQDPVIADDGYTYERFALQCWYDRGHRHCPLNPSASLSEPSTLQVNQDVKDEIETLVREHQHTRPNFI